MSHPWVCVQISRWDLRRFTERNDLQGRVHDIGFRLLFALTDGLAYRAFAACRWVFLTAALYLHGLLYNDFITALHELSQKTVFRRRWLNDFSTALYGCRY